MDAMAEIRETFFLECEELLEVLEANLLLMSEGDTDKETLNAIFRAAHSIKGGAGAFGFEALVRFAHRFETTLDEVRSDRLEGTQEVIAVFLRAADILADLVRAARDDTEFDKAESDVLIAELCALTNEEPPEAEPAGAESAGEDDEDPFGFEVVPLSFGAEEEVLDEYTIRFRPEKELLASGNEPGVLIRGVAELGEVTTVCDSSALASFDELNLTECQLGWVLTLKTDKEEEDIREVFEFVEGMCELVIEKVEAFSEPVADENGFVPMPISLDPIEETPVADAAPEVVAEEAAPAPVEKPAEAEKPAPAKAEAPKPAAKEKAKTPSAPRATVRVDLERVDRLINLVGELVINQAMLTDCLEETNIKPGSAVANGLDEFKQLTREIQESVMAIRAQPVQPLFQRMSRIVREGAQATGKTVRLQTVGENTEIDKTVIERLSEPLTHMIRNAIDHGLESTETRVENGKDSTGTVTLTAGHRSGRVVIEICDDGGGINRAKVQEIATEKGLIPEDADLTNSEIDNLLFMPGFSTAKEVTDLSGRGVGMDVVKRAIANLGGRISITSEPGQGTSFIISLPLTLAVLDGIIVSVAEQTLVVPMTAIVETLKPKDIDVHTIGTGASVISVRGKFVPIVDVGLALQYRTETPDFNECVMLLLEGEDGQMVALAVDYIQDQRQVVIKGLEDNYGYIPGVAAATILGDGRIALILDPDTLATRAEPGYPVNDAAKVA